MYEDDVGVMVANLEGANTLLVKRKTIVQCPGVCVAYGCERLIEAAVQEFMDVPSEKFGIRLLFSRELHVARC